MSKYFGTDGFRGEAGVALTADHAYRVGRFIGRYLAARSKNEKARVVVGKDTRLSSYMFEYALVAGIVASGADAYMMHVTTTPSVAFITRTDKFDCGIMISASHNAYTDNGIKLLNGQGEKEDGEMIALLEDYLDGKPVEGMENGELPFAKGNEIGKIVDYTSGRNRYIGYLISLGVYSFRGVKVGLDCANGASWYIAKSVFEALGATTYVINNRPDGTNINENAGSTHIEGLCKLVKEEKLDIGFAFDGDADRCLAVDERGRVLTGDHILLACALHLKEKGNLLSNTVVTTVMSNLGLYKALDKAEIGYEKTAVGDKYVYEAMRARGSRLGGEQSGHIIFSKYATTGDGILTSLKVMEVMLAKKTTAGKLYELMQVYPQTLINVTVRDKAAVQADARVQAAVSEAEQKLGENGRVLVRGSGTEPLVRVMVEASTQKDCKRLAEKIASAVRAADRGAHR